MAHEQKRPETGGSPREARVDARVAHEGARTCATVDSTGSARGSRAVSRRRSRGARAICRRSERAVTPLVLAGDCDDAVAVYLNRLSDYLFVAARTAAAAAAAGEVVYQKPR